MWSYQGHGQEVVPADALFHRSSDSERLESGLVAEFYQRGGSVETFPDPAASAFDELLLQVAADSNRSDALRAQAAAAVVGHLTSIDPPLFGFLLASTDEYHGPLLRMDAADALAAAPLDDEQLLTLCDAIATAGVLEVPRLVQAFAAGNSDRVGLALVAALNQSPGLKSLAPETLAGVLSGYSDAVRDGAEPLFEQLRVDLEQQQARLVELEGALAGGDVQRGRELFFANQKAICATCHTVQGKGGKIGPDLSKIGAIRTPRDLLEAIVLPSASFARGYEPFHVVTDSGQVFSGIIAREAADTLFLVGSNRLEVRLPREAVESMAQSHTSIMPEGMEKQLSGQELADLIEFLGSLR
jgi:putative heme-binding domain-containing protein